MPVEKISAYQCSYCASLHLGVSLAKRCSAKCYRRDLAKRKQERVERDAERLGNTVRLQARCYDEIWDLLTINAKKYMDMKVVFTKVPDRFGMVSNTHGAPIGGVENWGQKSDKPCGYPGWNGRFEGEVKLLKRRGKGEVDLHSLFGHWGIPSYNVGFTFTGFHTGTGCPSAKFSISGYIFLQDFPKVQSWWEGKKIAERLMGVPNA